MTDTALIENGIVSQVWRDTTTQMLEAEGVAGTLVEFEPPTSVVCGMLWNGSALSVSTPAPTEADYSNAIQSYVDQVAQSKQYTDGNSCATYALLAESPQGTLWKEEALAFVAWRANVWAYAFQQFALVQSGQRSQPTVAQILAEVEAIAITWPSAA
jgi:hypothetical protein